MALKIGVGLLTEYEVYKVSIAHECFNQVHLVI